MRAAGTSSNPGLTVQAFRQGLQELGYTEGKNIHVEYRYVEGALGRIPNLVDELLQQKVDVLVCTSSSLTRAAKQATKSIPIVMVTGQDPVATGIVDSLARPGGNVTGVTRLSRELSGKRLELLAETIPNLSRVAVLWDASAPGTAIGFEEYEAAARTLKIQLLSLGIPDKNPDLADSFRTANKARANALIAISNTLLLRYTKRIADLAIRQRLPSMHEDHRWIEAGGLMSYSADDAGQYKRAAAYVDKVLKGAKPAELPVEQPTKFELAINLKTAKQIGVTIPPACWSGRIK